MLTPFLRALSAAVSLLVLSHCGTPAALYEEPYESPLAEYRYSCRPIDSAIVAAVLPELEERFGRNLEADMYRDKILAALSFYPKLRTQKIRLVRKSLRTSMAARPKLLSGGRRRRTYTIFTDDVSDKPSDFRNASYAAQVGCFIHELGHISYYADRSDLQLTGDGLAYVTNQRFKNRYERVADSLAIRNGGGYYVYLYRTFTFEEADLPDTYLAFKRRNYTDNRRLLVLHLRYLRENSVDKCQDLKPYTP
ncbi:hypothetical protein [Lewinella sp. IMCC34183]|uniref:hypothetical protein n=1 Tax=Lewinella sp. IMCC34183 TaxID=2248762 RepID=UPI00130037FC|nr:hypothetical protein [Lewinella sp. IMCC34183]